MLPPKIEINVDEFVSTIYNTMEDSRLGNSSKDTDKEVLKYIQKIEEKEEVAYRCFSLINAFEYGLSMEERQHELLNALFVQRVAEHFDQAGILSFEEAEDFLCGRITYYFEVWQKYNKKEERPKLLMAIACMLVYHKPYEEYMSKEEEIDWSLEFIMGVGSLGTSHTIEFAKGYFEKIGQKYQVVFIIDDWIRHGAYAMHYNELTNKWRKMAAPYN